MTVSGHPIWVQIVERLQAQIKGQGYSTWIEPLKPREITADAIHLEVPNAFIIDWIDSHYLDQIRGIAHEVMGLEPEIVFHVRERAAEATGTGMVPARQDDDPRTYLDAESRLNRQFAFGNFVVGSGNQLAVAGAKAVADRPGQKYNPLFLYGGVGLGKTHLMHAIGHALKLRKPEARVLYVSSERFTNDLIASLRSNDMVEFKQRYRSLDLLLIDDIQFLAGKERTQEEFFHTFNSLHENFKQIVMSSDQAPRDIAELQERLVSRFNWGLVCDISPPDLETRVAILHNRAVQEGVELSRDVALYIAHNVTSNVRDLEGALSKVMAFARLSEQPITLPLAEEVLEDLVRRPERRLGMAEILRETCTFFGVPEEQVRGPRRMLKFTRPRQVSMYLTRSLTRHSLGEIGSHFGDRDHTTVMHSVDKISGLMETDPVIREAVARIRERLTSGDSGG